MSVDVSALVTENLDIWSSTIKAKNSQGRGSSKKTELYGVKKLRELILELAVRGLLVPQDPSDEFADKLIDRSVQYKEKVATERKLRKDKEIYSAKELYAIPDSWAWCCIGQFAHVLGGKRVPRGYTLLDTPTDHAYIRVTDMKNNSVSLNNLKYIDSEIFEKISKYTINKDDVYITIAGSIGVVGSIPEMLDGMNLTENAGKLVFGEISRDFLVIVLSSNYVQGQFSTAVNQMAQPKLSLSSVKNTSIAIPPTEEQHRIVTKVNELMTLCDQLEQQQESSISAHQTLVETLLGTLVNAADAKSFSAAWQRIAENFDVLFTTEHSIEQLKKTILQLAVMGKLVPQDPNDEPASVLLEKIAKEKERLVKEKKIKKQKPLPPISDEEKPFELPAGWGWTRISSISDVGTGATPSRTNYSYFNPPEVNWVTSGETSDDFVGDTREKVSWTAVKETNISVYPPGTLIVAMYGQGKTRGQITELLKPAGTNQACAAIKLIDQDAQHRKYIKIFFIKAYDEIRKISAGGAQPNLNVGKVSLTVVPVPPMEEQHRIVTKVNELMTLCDTVLERIMAAQTTQLNFTDAITKQATA